MRPDVGEEDSPLIYGVEAACRALAPGPSGGSDGSHVRFVVGTQVLKGENGIHVLEYGEETHSLSKALFKHDAGEVWHISSSPDQERQQFATSYSSLTPDGKTVNKCSIWKYPIDLSNSIIDEESLASDLIKVLDLDNGLIGERIEKSSVWKPDEGNEILTFGDDKIFIWDLEQQKVKSVVRSASSRLAKVTTVKWSPHNNASVLGLAVGSNFIAIDMRQDSSQNPAYTIPAHNHYVRDLDFNANAQYVLATCGDDCETRYWDIRNKSAPAVSFLNHAHWIWSVRFNQFHDQLVLSAGSDSKVLLTRVASLASQPFGHLLEDSSDEDVLQRNRKKDQRQLSDKVIAAFEEHEDSVYSAEWSTADAWTFASVSFDGRVVINKVPKAEKMNILF